MTLSLFLPIIWKYRKKFQIAEIAVGTIAEIAVVTMFAVANGMRY